MTDQTRDQFYRSKHKLKSRAYTLGKRYSRIFRSVKLGDELHIGEVYDLTHATLELGRAIEALASQATSLDLAQKVFKDLTHEAYKLSTCCGELRKVTEAYAGFSVRMLPVYEPDIRRETAVENVKSHIGEMIRDLEG